MSDKPDRYERVARDILTLGQQTEAYSPDIVDETIAEAVAKLRAAFPEPRIHDPRCMDCGIPYGSPDWVDTTLSDDQWLRLVGSPDGILCANCIVKRASKLPEVVAMRAKIEFANEPPEGTAPRRAGNAGDDRAAHISGNNLHSAEMPTVPTKSEPQPVSDADIREVAIKLACHAHMFCDITAEGDYRGYDDRAAERAIINEIKPLISRAVEAERERCALVAEKCDRYTHDHLYIAAAIRKQEGT